MIIENLNDNEAWLTDILDRLLVLETKAPTGFTAVTRGSLRIASPEGLIVEGSGGILLEGLLDATGEIRVSGLLKVSGTAEITGALSNTGSTNFSGNFTASGNNTLSGQNRLTGPTWIDGLATINGNTNVYGTLNISGATTVHNNFQTNGSTTLGGSVNISGPTTVNSSLTTSGSTTLGGSVNITGSTTLASTLTVNGMIRATGGAGETRLDGTGLQTPNLIVGRIVASGLPVAGSIEGHNFLSIRNDVVYSVPQSIGSPLGGDVRWPFDPAGNTDEYGPRVSPGGIGSTFHRGMDFGAGIGEGTPIHAAARGTVVTSGSGGGFGNFVLLQHSGNLRTLYAHMASPFGGSNGDVVSQGQVIGPVGNTGNSTGPHLHWETHKPNGSGEYEAVNPRDVMGTTPWKEW